MKWGIKRFKSVVFIGRQTRVCAESSFPERKNSHYSFNWLVSAAIFAANEDIRSPWRWSVPVIPVSEEAAETIWRAVNAISTCQNTFNFFDYLVIFRHYFTGDGKVSCILAMGGAVTSWLVPSSPDRAVRVRALAGDIVLCSWARRFTLTVPLSTQVYKWIPANVMLGVTLRWTSIPSRGE